MTSITILADNRPHPNISQLKCEHGFSALIQTEKGKKLLCDMGLSDNFLSNAQYINEYLSDIDIAFISHGHKDHSGGLSHFLINNNSTKIYLSDLISGSLFYSYRHGNKRDISTDNNLIISNKNRMVLLNAGTWIDKDIAITKNTINKYPQPQGNKHLTTLSTGIEKNDDFNHELSLVIKTCNGLIIMSPCSHNGVINIIESAKIFTGENNVNAFIGGMHLVDSDNLENEVEELVHLIRDQYSNTMFYTGHCTCDKAISILRNEPNIQSFHTGMTITIK